MGRPLVPAVALAGLPKDGLLLHRCCVGLPVVRPAVVLSHLALLLGGGCVHPRRDRPGARLLALPRRDGRRILGPARGVRTQGVCRGTSEGKSHCGRWNRPCDFPILGLTPRLLPADPQRTRPSPPSCRRSAGASSASGAVRVPRPRQPQGRSDECLAPQRPRRTPSSPPHASQGGQRPQTGAQRRAPCEARPPDNAAAPAAGRRPPGHGAPSPCTPSSMCRGPARWLPLTISPPRIHGRALSTDQRLDVRPRRLLQGSVEPSRRLAPSSASWACGTRSPRGGRGEAAAARGRKGAVACLSASSIG
jgi:hypothetical protein